MFINISPEFCRIVQCLLACLGLKLEKKRQKFSQSAGVVSTIEISAVSCWLDLELFSLIVALSLISLCTAKLLLSVRRHHNITS